MRVTGDKMPEPKLIDSPLCDTIERDGISLEVAIYRSDDSQWILEVVDESGTSIVWDEQFATDRAALDELMKTIDRDGIKAIVEG
jgi:hypothetical protein